MTYRCFERERMDKYLETECYRKTDEVFKISHIHVTLPVRAPLAQVPETLPETDLVPLVLGGWAGVQALRSGSSPPSPPQMQIVLIRGDTGTGKTELCKFIECALKDEEYFLEQVRKYGRLTRESFREYVRQRENVDCKHIERGQISAVGALTIPFAISYSPEEIDSKIRDLSVDIKQAFYRHLRIHFVTERSIYTQLVPCLELLLASQDKFTEVISRNLDRHLGEISGSERERQATLSSLELVTRRDLQELGLNPSEPEIERINSGLIEALARMLYSGGITGALEHFLKKSNDHGRFPVIIMDDLSLINTQNLTTIIDFLTGIAGQGYHATFVLGMTTGRAEEESLARRGETRQPRIWEIDTIRPRIFDIDLSPTERTAGWLTPEKTVGFVEKYLKLVRSEDCPERCGEPHTEISKNMPELYPFNENFVKRTCQYLPKTPYGLTPRGLLSIIYHVLSSEKKAHLAIDEFLRHQKGVTDYEPFSGLSDETKDEFQEAALAAFWYGVVEKDSFSIETKILKALGSECGKLEVSKGISRIPLQYPVSLLIEREARPSRDQAELVRHLTKLQRWVDDHDSSLNTETEGILQRILISTVAAATSSSVADLGLMARSSYRANIDLIWRFGRPKVIISKSSQIGDASEPAFFFTFKEIKRIPSNYCLVKLTLDEFKLLVEDELQNNKISKSVVENRLWELKKAVSEYRDKLYALLKEQLKEDPARAVASACIFLHSVLLARPLPSTRPEIVKELHTLLRSDSISSFSQYVKVGADKVSRAAQQLPALLEILRGFVLVQKSVVDPEKLNDAAPDNRRQIFEILEHCTPNAVHKGFLAVQRGRLESPLSIVLQFVLEGMSAVRKFRFDAESAEKQVREWNTVIDLYDEGVDGQIAELEQTLSDATRAGVLPAWQCQALVGQVVGLRQSPSAEDITKLRESLRALAAMKVEPNSEEPYVLATALERFKGDPSIRYFNNLVSLIDGLERQLSAKSASETTRTQIDQLLNKCERLERQLEKWVP